MEPREILAWNIKKYRTQRGLSQEALATEAGLERVAVSQIERKKVNLGIDSVGKIAKTLGIAITDLWVIPSENEEEPRNLRRGRRRLK